MVYILAYNREVMVKKEKINERFRYITFKS